jgi:hypothetical protein
MIDWVWKFHSVTVFGCVVESGYQTAKWVTVIPGTFTWNRQPRLQFAAPPDENPAVEAFCCPRGHVCAKAQTEKAETAKMTSKLVNPRIVPLPTNGRPAIAGVSNKVIEAMKAILRFLSLRGKAQGRNGHRLDARFPPIRITPVAYLMQSPLLARFTKPIFPWPA